MKYHLLSMYFIDIHKYDNGKLDLPTIETNNKELTFSHVTDIDKNDIMKGT